MTHHPMSIESWNHSVIGLAAILVLIALFARYMHHLGRDDDDA